MTTGTAGTASPVGPGAQATMKAGRAIATAAIERARAQQRHAATAQRYARQQCREVLNAWPALHGLASHLDLRRYPDVLGLVLEAASALYRGCRSISLTSVDQLSGDECPYSTVASTGESSAVDDAQYRLEEGPCIDATAMDLLTSVCADDLTTEVACWPRFCEAAGALGVRSTLSISLPWSAFRLGLQAEQHAVGAINFYSAEVHAFDRSEVKAVMFGSWAGSMLTGRRPAEVYESC
ncbi:hypothetical protein HH311_25505, partial [Actinomycetospora sp. TBRC 11914]|nr:hypothetical protein [Actinomycetospora sp. TBRC 11914]